MRTYCAAQGTPASALRDFSGKEIPKEDIRVHTADSLCYTVKLTQHFKAAILQQN